MALSRPLSLLTLGLGLTFLPTSSDAQAQSSSPPGVVLKQAVVTQIRPPQGEAWRTPHLGSTRIPLTLRQALEPHDLLVTGEGVWVQLLLPPVTQVWIGPKSQVLLKNLSPQEGPSTVELLVGKVRATLGSLLSSGEEPFFLQAETVFAAPRGTDFLMERSERRTLELTVLEGEVALGREGQPDVRIRAGEGVTLSLDGPLPLPGVRSSAELEQKRQGPTGGFTLEDSLSNEVPSSHWPSLGAGLEDISTGRTFDPVLEGILPLLVPPARTWTVEVRP